MRRFLLPVFLNSENRFASYPFPFLEDEIEDGTAGNYLPQLSREEMLEDFDVMTEALRDAMPHAPAVQAGFGIDIWRKLDGYRSRITNEETPLDFMRLLSNALSACKGHHLWLHSLFWWADDDPWFQGRYGDKISPEAIRINKQMHSLLRSVPPVQPPAPMRFLYWDGSYYTAPEFTLNGRNYHGPFKLLAVDGRTPEEIEPLTQDSLALFDSVKKCFYQPDFYASLPQKVPGSREFLFESPEKEKLTLVISDAAKLEQPPRNQFFWTPKQVLFLKEHDLVYIRVPAMNPEDLPFYREKLLPILKQEKPRYAVIDIRGNGGGSDLVPSTLIAMILAHPIPFTGVLGTPANERIREYARNKLDDSTYGNGTKTRTIPFLKNRLFDIFDFEGTIESEPDACVEHVYVIAHNVYSSAGTLVAMAKTNPRIMTSVGFTSPQPLGVGFEPYFFSLPNSCLVISVEPAIDLTDSRSAEDTLHLDIGIELNMSPEEYLAYVFRPIPEEKQNYLEKEDPFMLKIFDLIREREAASGEK